MVTVHAAAKAVGIAAAAMATNTAPARARTATHLRRPLTAATLQPSRWCALQGTTAGPCEDWHGSYWLVRSFAISNQAPPQSSFVCPFAMKNLRRRPARTSSFRRAADLQVWHQPVPHVEERP